MNVIPRVMFTAVCYACAIQCAAAAPKPVPVKDLFRNYDYGSMSMSPDGEWLVSIYPSELNKRYTRAIASVNVDSGEGKILLLNHRIWVMNSEWVGPRRQFATVFGINYSKGLGAGLYAFDCDGSRSVEIVSPDRPSALVNIISENPYSRLKLLFDFRFPKVVTFVGNEPDVVLVAQEKRGDEYEKARRWIDGGAPPLPGVYSVNTVTGKYALHTADPGWSEHWFADPEGKVRFAFGFNKEEIKADGRLHDPTRPPTARAYWFTDEGKPSEISGIKMAQDDGFLPLGFDREGKRFLFSGRQEGDLAAIYAYDPRAGKVSGPLVRSNRVDIESAILSPHDKTVAGVRVDDGMPRVYWLDPILREIQPTIDASLPGRFNEIREWTQDYGRVLVLSSSSKDPGRYYVLDRAKGSMREVYVRASWLASAEFGHTEPFSIKARDGLTLHGYLTRPPGAAKDARLPMVLLVHGGPWSIRDYATFSEEVQFYATRGYAVMQVNFRMSGGYGRQFEKMGVHQMGRDMQTDLYDAVDWAVEQGIADPNRLIIAGGSYGGYAALMGVIQQPERFKAAIAMFPLVDLFQQVEDLQTRKELKPWTNAEMHLAHFVENVGDPEAQRSFLKAVSPTEHVDKIKVPLFIVYGPKDEIIDKEQVKRFISRLRSHKVKFVHFAPRDEGHGIGDEDRRLEVYAALEKFLEKL